MFLEFFKFATSGAGAFFGTLALLCLPTLCFGTAIASIVEAFRKR